MAIPFLGVFDYVVSHRPFTFIPVFLYIRLIFGRLVYALRSLLSISLCAIFVETLEQTVHRDNSRVFRGKLRIPRRYRIQDGIYMVFGMQNCSCLQSTAISGGPLAYAAQNLRSPYKSLCFATKQLRRPNI